MRIQDVFPYEYWFQKKTGKPLHDASELHRLSTEHYRYYPMASRPRVWPAWSQVVVGVAFVIVAIGCLAGFILMAGGG